MNSLKIGISGVRGTVCDSLTPTLLTRFARKMNFIDPRRYHEELHELFYQHQPALLRMDFKEGKGLRR